MTVPDVKLSITDGALGILPAETDSIALLMGCSASGTPATMYGIATLDDVVTNLGVGPLAEAAAYILATVPGASLYCVPLTQSTAGANGAVTQVGTGLATVALSGAPKDGYEGVVEIVTAGAVGTATFKYTLDGGDTWSAEVVTAGSYAIVDPRSGITLITLTMSSGPGNFVAGDTYSWTSTAPGFSTSDVAAAMTVVLADSREWGMAFLVGEASSVANSASMASALATHMTSAETAHRYAFAIMGCANDTDANTIAGFVSFSSARVSVAPGFCELSSALTGRVHKRSAAWPIAARVLSIGIGEDAGRVKTGPLPGAVVSITRDERKTPGLDAARFSTLRTIIGREGFYVNACRMMVSTTSDFQFVQARRVMDRACKVARNRFLDFLNDSVRVNGADHVTPGSIYELDARAIETLVDADLNASLVEEGHATAAQTIVNRTDVILSTAKLRGKVRITPLGYNRAIEVEMGFYNPALAAAS